MRPLDHHRLGVLHLRLQICDGLLRSVTALASTSDLAAQSVRAHAWLLLWREIDAMRATLARHGRPLHDLDRARARRGSVVLVATNHAAPTTESRGAAADSLAHIRALVSSDLRHPPRLPPAPVLRRPDHHIPIIVFIALGISLLSNLLILATM